MNYRINMNDISLPQAYPVHIIEIVPPSLEEVDDNRKIELKIGLMLSFSAFVCMAPFIVFDLYYSNDRSCAMQDVGRYGQLKLSYIMIVDASISILENIYIFYFMCFVCTVKQIKQLIDRENKDKPKVIHEIMDYVHFFILMLYIFQFWTQMDIQKCSNGIYYYINIKIFICLLLTYRYLHNKST